MSVKVGKDGTIVLPKSIRQKYGIHEGMRVIIREYSGGICLVPVKTYANPTEALYGSVKVEKSIDDPKQLATEQIRKQLLEQQ